MLADGFGMFAILIWLTGLALGVYLFILLVKLLRRGIIALDLYNHAKNLEIRERYESVHRSDNI
ncbi:hypothetical protein [Paenibacillus piscarius]|uniref:hypothetical protein n=1 Tax=Paenibacillus piscarius TaxID=1089681 RepID=UPI001EE8F415|nr:hypothetical protein [Paenibacillus piscarius]